MLEARETPTLSLQSMLLVIILAPAGDIDRLMEAVGRLTPLPMGNYDCNAFQSASGIERYRPRHGAAPGAEDGLRQRPGIVEISFELPHDLALLDRIVDAIFLTHSYEEPVIRVLPILTSRSKGTDQTHNPYRWWNTGGDWKSATRPTSG
jgi:hypothetical protein